jgi:hypothetical protein
MGLGGRPGNEHILPGSDQRSCDRGDLVRRLSLAEDNLRKALPYMTMLVDTREAKVLVRALAQELKELLVRGFGCSAAGPYFVQQGPQVLSVHRPKWLK